ncbi:hypothetical protein BJ878DRAFT_42179 [Calycina marina]|uniref:Uncharacterized protein n=1 Tax=Calycina marina TaxID=1763456 RepID=A0A9P7Z3J8_9HELO|nr:hypothetical protein BJ878DRAFT_42179 [Calycina marina]
MKGPLGIIGSKGKACVSEVLLKGSNGKFSKEYDLPIDSKTNATLCYVLTANDDVVTIHYSMDAGMVDFTDIVCDGILRESVIPHRAGSNFKGAVEKVLERGDIINKKTSRRGLAKYSKPLVCTCDAKIDSITTATEKAQSAISTVIKTQSSVGMVGIQLFKKRLDDTTTADGLAQRAETFENVGHWTEFNHNAQQSSNVSFELGFTGATKNSKSAHERVAQEWPASYERVGSFKFLLRSAADLVALGFKNIPTYVVEPLPVPTIRVVTSSSKASTPVPSKTSTRASTAQPNDSNDQDSFLSRRRRRARRMSRRSLLPPYVHAH